MSLSAMIWALKKAPVSSPAAKLVLVGLADHAKDDGTAAWPSQATLAGYSECSDRTVRRHLEHLEEIGVIRRGDQQLVSHIPSYLRPVVWDLVMTTTRENTTPGQIVRGSEQAAPPDKMSGDPGAGVRGPRTPVSAPPGAGDRGPRTPVSDKPSLEPSFEPSEEPGAADKLCELLAELIGQRIGEPYTITAADRSAAADLLRTPGRVVPQIERVIRYAAADPWWATRVTGMPSIARHWLTLAQQSGPINAGRAAGIGNETVPVPDDLPRHDADTWRAAWIRHRQAGRTPAESTRAADTHIGRQPQAPQRAPMPDELRGGRWKRPEPVMSGDSR